LTTQVKQPTGVEAQVQQFVATVQRQLAATQPATPAVYQTERSMRQLLEQAQLQGIPLQMEYRSPAAQENSRWEIRVREIHESNAVTYVEADCPLLGASRTFRLDRILRLWEVEARGKIPPISASA
jgi:predicted DNA-binding transcriptional regulator YafY